MSDHTPLKRPCARRSCIFKTEFVRDQVDPRVKAEWEARTGDAAPFGDLRSMWVREHCVRVSPGEGLCPYREEQCAMAFLAAIQTSLTARTNPRGYFRRVAKSMALVRLDEKPLARETGPGDPGRGTVRHSEGPRVFGPEARPHQLGELLRALDLGPRERPTNDGEKGTK